MQVWTKINIHWNWNNCSKNDFVILAAATEVWFWDHKEFYAAVMNRKMIIHFVDVILKIQSTV